MAYTFEEEEEEEEEMWSLMFSLTVFWINGKYVTSQ
jgi:hypothetical protein